MQKYCFFLKPARKLLIFNEKGIDYFVICKLFCTFAGDKVCLLHSFCRNVQKRR